jgi:peptidoglycan hydrolase-like protein with peptidoglycan-binding domain
MRKTLITITALTLMLAGGLPVFAQTATSSASSALLQLQTQVADLQAKLAALKTAQTSAQTSAQSVGQSLQLLSTLKAGMSGDDVKLLQSILASDPTIFSGQVTGFFGPQTQKAVAKFQKNNGISATGNVGPLTRDAFNKLLKGSTIIGSSTASTTLSHGEGDENGVKFCLGVAPGHLIAPGRNKGEGEHGKGNSNGGVASSTLQGNVLTCTKIPPGIAKKLGLFTTLGGGHGSTTPPVVPPPADTTPPVITNIVSTPGSATTTVAWTTNEAATSKVLYSTTTPVTTSAASVSSSSLVTTHSLNLTGLTASSTYFALIISADAAGNTATSAQISFIQP